LVAVRRRRRGATEYRPILLEVTANMTWWVEFPTVALISFLLTWALRRYALRRGLLDMPNERSSHSSPTPRGAGIAIVVSFVGCVPLLWLQGALALDTLLALTGAGLWIALIGFLDDHRSLPSHWKLAAHFLAAVWVLTWLGGMPPVTLGGLTVTADWLRAVFACLYIVWLLNLYNFMDGIDGIAGIEAITVCVGAALLYAIGAPQNVHWTLPALLLAAVVGFFGWNYPKASVFMGDAGSGFLGLTIATLSIQSASIKPEYFWAWVILLGVFVVDATFTLCRRMLRGEKYNTAHRNHAYQHAARRLGAHKPVTITVGVINLVWLLPWALLVGLGRCDPALGLSATYLPLIVGAVYLNAGAPERQAALDP
jgi:Fuc2NAc and GlcNAc transferase